MKTKRKVAPLAATLIIIGSLAGGVMAQSFVDWTGVTDGATSGTGSWTGFDDVSYSITALSNTNFIGSDSILTPIFDDSIERDLSIFGINDSLGINSFRISPGSLDGTNNIGYDISFTYFSGAFPANDPVFYLGDVDFGDFEVSATLGGVAVNTSSWYVGVGQTSSSGSGIPSTWNAATSTLEGQGQSENWVHQFKPDAAYDTLTFSYRNGARHDTIWYAVGDVAIVPEPSSALLLGLGGLGLLARRRR